MTIGLESLDLLTVGQVSRALHIHPNTVRRWSDNGILESYRISECRDRRFRKEDVIRLLFESWLPDYDEENTDQKESLFIHV
ncbi:MAG: helix-turn-helix domain-containing protein [Chloroflexota bacterium]